MTISQLLKKLFIITILSTPLVSFSSDQLLVQDQSIESNTTFDEYSHLEYSDILFDDEDSYDFANGYLDSVASNKVVSNIDPAHIMIIVNLLGIPEIAQESIYLHSNILNQRNLLDQPIFEPTRSLYPKKNTLGFDAFLRRTTRSNFTKKHTKLSSYVALTEKKLIDKLQNAVEKISQFLPVHTLNVEKIFNLFENMTVEQRQVGFMTHFMKTWHKTTFRFILPIYYLENNFSLTKKEQDAVAQEFGVMDPKEEKIFRKAHFICDKIGIGDMRIEIDQRVLKRPLLTLRAGIQATIPTAFSWGTGFVGSSYSKPSTLPTFDIEPLFDALESAVPNAEQIAINSLNNFLLDSFDRLAANLIDIKMGNNRHLGIGIYARTKTPLKAYLDSSFAKKITLTNRISAEFFLPATEKRFYTTFVNEQQFATRNFEDPNQAAENLKFLEEQLIERLFLRALPTRITPGTIFRWTNAIIYTHHKIGFTAGTDFWIQDKDRFSTIYASRLATSTIDIPKAKPPFASQSKAVAGITFKHKNPRAYLFMALNGDVTFSNKGLGEDYGISLNFEANF